MVNSYYQNIENIVNKDKIDEDYKERVENADFKDFGGLFDDKEWRQFGDSYWDPNYTALMTEIKSRGLDQEINFNFVPYLKNSECANMMGANQISIPIESGNVMVGETDTGEGLYNFLALQIDENKKLISVVIRYSDILTKFIDELLPSIKDSEEQLELDINVFKYLKYFVASYNSEYLTLSGQDQIRVRHSKGSREDLLTETMNENSWQEFLYDSIRGSLSGNKVMPGVH